MAKQRYAIVKVECPARNEIDGQFVCFPEDNECSGCRYGDTKQQLMNKVITALNRAGIDYVQLTKKQIAEAIIEFLGVKECRK